MTTSTLKPDSVAAQALADPEREKRIQFTWLLIILGFFSVQAILWTVAISLTMGDRSHAVAPGYYEQGTDAPSRRELVAASKALGWTAEIRVDDELDVLGRRKLVVTLADREGAPVSCREATVTLFHCGHAADATTLTLSETVPGDYVSKSLFPWVGRWDFSLDCRRDDERFVEHWRLNVDEGG